MNIFLAEPSALQNACLANNNHKKIIPYNKSILENTLREKNTYLIDCFDTFLPVNNKGQRLTLYRQGGMLSILEKTPLREGFKEFISYNSKVTIGIHSDSVYFDEFSKINQEWCFDVNFFGREFVKPATGFFPLYRKQKRFDLMMYDVQSTKTNTLVIADGKSDIKPCKYYDLDILIIPDFNSNPSFDFRDLIFDDSFLKYRA